MSLPWFRLYHELKDDPKMGALDDASFRVYIESLCWACEAQKNGDTGLTVDDANWAFRRNVTEPLLKLFHVGILVKTNEGGIIIPKWEERQKRSDSSTERVRKHRAKEDVTLHVTGVKRYSNGAEESRGEKSRVEEKRVEERKEASPSPSPSPSPEPKSVTAKRGVVAPLLPQVREVFDSWNLLGCVPQCLLVSDKRRRILESRLREDFFQANWKLALEKIKTTPFLKGQNDRGWKANLDWFLKPDTCASIIEGKYEGTQTPGINGKNHHAKPDYTKAF